MKRIADLDGITFMANSLRKFIAAESLNHEVIESLIYACLLIGGIDKKFCVKMRLVGLLPKLASALCKAGPPPVSCLIDLLIALCHSARNAMAFTKNENLVAYLLNCIVQGLEDKSESIRKCTELVYYLSKPKKTRLLLINADAVPVILNVFEEFFRHRQEHSSLMVSLAALGILRLLTAKNSGRKKLIAANGLPIFQAAVTECIEQDQTPSLLTSELHYAVSTICLRCVPAVALPLPSTDHVISLDLPTKSYVRLVTADDASDSEEDMHIETAIMTDVEDEVSALGDAKVPRVKLAEGDRRLYQAICIEFYMGATRCSQVHVPPSSASFVDDLDFDTIHDGMDRPSCNSTLKRCRSFPCKLDFLSTRQNQSAFLAPKKPHYSFTGCADSYDWEDYAAQVLTTKSIIPFTSVPFPEFYDSYPDLCHQRQKFYPSALLERVFPLLERIRNPSFPAVVVYDFDQLVNGQNSLIESIQPMLNDDIFKIGRPDKTTSSLVFDSRFESGNLRKVIQVNL
ncbi:unnamed protein product, partial [Soboliphyme baturini]|uniref:Cytosolic carboxypeptidase 1 n=1 Tax=Soboliphyme baturini TaxID=241478 RepID=A0A183J030_9BILA